MNDVFEVGKLYKVYKPNPEETMFSLVCFNKRQIDIIKESKRKDFCIYERNYPIDALLPETILLCIKKSEFVFASMSSNMMMYQLYSDDFKKVKNNISKSSRKNLKGRSLRNDPVYDSEEFYNVSLIFGTFLGKNEVYQIPFLSKFKSIPNDQFSKSLFKRHLHKWLIPVETTCHNNK